MVAGTVAALAGASPGHPGRPGPGRAAARKATAWPALAVALALVAARDGKRAAGWRLLTGPVLMFAVAPASRFGYAVYPLGLACWLLLTERGPREQGPQEQSPQEQSPRGRGPRESACARTVSRT
jgi:hypothetical protein